MGKRAGGVVADGAAKASAYYHDHVRPAFDISITRFRIEVTSNSMPVLCPSAPRPFSYLLACPFHLYLLPATIYQRVEERRGKRGREETRRNEKKRRRGRREKIREERREEIRRRKEGEERRGGRREDRRHGEKGGK